MQKKLSTRRVFLQKGMTLLAVAPTIPTFLDQTVMAIANPNDTLRTQAPSGKDGKILVVVQLSGGNDGLNTVVPYGDDAYHRARPAIGHAAKDVLKINDYIGLHPSLGPMKELYDNGMLSIIQGVGYPNPNRSHFRSMDIWQSAAPEKEITTSGWLGRYFDCTCSGEDPHVGVAIGGQMPLAMKGDRVMPLSFDHPESYRYNGSDVKHYLELNQKEGYEPAPAPTKAAGIIRPSQKKVEVTEQSQLDFLHRTAMDAQVSSDDILRITRNHRSAAAYPYNDLGNGLKTVAAMINGGLPTRVYYVSMGGFDTHAGERGRHDKLMADFAQGVGAFWKDLKAQGNSDRVLMMTFSEFGRRVAQNASGGTDHGTAAPMFVIGAHSNLKQGVIGNHPSLTNLDQGDLKFTTDFRSVYATVLENWMNTPSKPILSNQFQKLSLVKA